MQFIVIAHDGTDSNAIERRIAVREDHIRQGKAFYDSGKWLYAAGILDDEGILIGSMIMCDFPSQTELENQWLKNEPYIVGKVWEKIEIHRAHVAPFILTGKKER
jgi:uncharacterized protein YciI